MMPKAKPFSEREKQYILDNFAFMTVRQIAEKLNRKSESVKNWTVKLGLRRGTRWDWSSEDVEKLKQLYTETPNTVLSKILNVSVQRIYAKASKLGLKKSDECVSLIFREKMKDPNHRARLTRFRKGQPSWNKGKKIGSRGRSTETQFKKGHKPSNHVPIGTEVVNTDGYWKVKIGEPNVWREKHKLIWAQKHGEPPKGFCVVFRDGNPLNCVYENLELISRGDLMRRNTIHNLPEDLKETIQVLGRLKRQINRRTKNAEK